MQAVGNSLATGRLQHISIQIEADDPSLRDRVEEFLADFVGDEGTRNGELHFRLRLCQGSERHAIPAAAIPTPLQFASVACLAHGRTLHFRTRDGSGLEAEIEQGRGFGVVTRDLTERRYAFADLLLAPIMEMLKHRGYYGLHAAAVSRGGAGYLFPAGSGQGKTTIALSLLREGFHYLADDKVLLASDQGEVTARAFTRRFNIDPDIGERYRELEFVARLPPLPGCGKRPVNVSLVYPGRFAAQCRPQVVIHLERTPHQESRIVPLSAKESFARLIRQTILSFDRGVAAGQLALLGRLVGQTRSYLLYNGNDLYGQPERLAELLPRV